MTKYEKTGNKNERLPPACADEFSTYASDKTDHTIQVFEKWMLDTYPTVLPKIKIGMAISYTYTLPPRLSRYVNDGRT